MSSEPSSTDAPMVQTEIERKYDVDESTVLPRFDGLDAAGVLSARTLGRFDLEAEYFDTAAQDLAGHRITLRRRSGGTDDGWHLKLPAEVGRTELHLPLDTAPSDDGSAVPASVLDPVRAIVRDRPVSLIARISTRRSITRLRGTDDAELVEIADDTVTASDAATGTVRIWREWEAELLHGAPTGADDRTALLDAVEERLRSAGARPASSASKLASALGRTTLGSPPVAPHLGGGGAASEVLLGAVRALVDEMVGLDSLVRRREPDSVHRLRTRVRRLRSVLSTYRTVFAPTDELRDGLRGFGVVLGRARDAEVMRERAGALVESHDGSPRSVGGVLVAGWEREYDRATTAVLAELSGERYYRLLDGLDEFVARPPLGAEAFATVEHVALRTLRKSVRRVLSRAKLAAKAQGTDVVSLLHETRKAAKRLRYAAEAVGGEPGVLGEHGYVRRVRRVSDAAESVHDLLGEHRDSVLLQEHLRVRATAEGYPFEYGVLHEVERQLAERALSEYVEALARLKKRGKALR